MIKYYSYKGDLIFDPFGGSGSTLRASKELKRDSYGFEIMKDICSRAQNEMIVFPETLF